jgi:hypothetical protein
VLYWRFSCGVVVSPQEYRNKGSGLKKKTLKKNHDQVLPLYHYSSTDEKTKEEARFPTNIMECLVNFCLREMEEIEIVAGELS